MSGIAGIFGKKAEEKTLRPMLTALQHRGPDGTVLRQGNGFTVGAVQLDTGPVHTKACSGNDRSAIAFDGLVVGTPDPDLPAVDMVLRQLADLGAGAFSRLNGAYSLALVGPDELVLVRDPVGSRSLFYGERDGTTFFATELKCLTGLVDQPRELPAGEVYSTQKGSSRLPVFSCELPSCSSPRETAQHLKGFLRQATLDRMHDGAVKGCGLSGGLDSSIIAALAYRIDPGIHFFTVGLENGPDLENARLMAKFLGAEKNHHVHIITEAEVEQAVPEAVRHLESFEEDCISGCLSNIFASRLAREHTAVSLSGEGSDELFGGYHLLKELASDEEKARMMDKLVAIAYNTALRRLDRGWFSHSVQYRTPFLDSRVVAYAGAIPVAWKIHGTEQTEKWILRETFRDILPPEIADRRKLRFAGGTGIDDIMDRVAQKHVSAKDFENHRTTAAGYALHSPKELWYYRLFKEIFPDDAYEEQVARWDPYK